MFANSFSFSLDINFYFEQIFNSIHRGARSTKNRFYKKPKYGKYFLKDPYSITIRRVVYRTHKTTEYEMHTQHPKTDKHRPNHSYFDVRKETCFFHRFLLNEIREYVCCKCRRSTKAKFATHQCQQNAAGARPRAINSFPVQNVFKTGIIERPFILLVAFFLGFLIITAMQPQGALVPSIFIIVVVEIVSYNFYDCCFGHPLDHYSISTVYTSLLY